jgi:hypothetical protein
MLLILLLLTCFIIITLPREVAAENTVVVTLDRETVEYLFEIPQTESNVYLSFAWSVEADSTYSGKVAFLQFSHNARALSKPFIIQRKTVLNTVDWFNSKKP